MTMGISRRSSYVIMLTVIATLAAGSASAQEKPKATATFNVEGQTYLGGEPVKMFGRIQPVTPGEVVRLETQVFRKSTSTWIAYDIVRTRTNDRGRFFKKHPAFPAGKRYRTRSLWKETAQHLAGRTIWDPFKVERRTH